MSAQSGRPEPYATQSLGGRLELRNPGDLAGDEKALYDRIVSTTALWSQKAGFETRSGEGQLIGPFNSFLFSPQIGSALVDLSAAEARHTSLSPRVREIVILTVGAARHCDYERYAHAAVARTVGLAPSAIAALCRGEGSDDLDENEDIARRYTFQLATAPRIEDALYAQAQSAFGDKGLVDLAILVGIYQLVSGLLNGFAIPAPSLASEA